MTARGAETRDSEQRVTRICARVDCGAPFFTTLYSPEAFCSPRCRNKAKGQNR